jgi:hypothetical protein
MLIFGFDLAKAPWLMIGYILLSIISLIYGTTYVNSINQVRAVIFAIGFFLILLYFGIKWFGSTIPQLKSWPPVINMCPDYLTYITIPSTTVNGVANVKAGCIDMLGVTTSSSADAIQKTDSSTAADFKAGTTTNISKKMFEYTSASVKKATTPAELQAICARCQQLGITWEGVYDGDACIGISSTANVQAAVEKCLLSV